MIRFVPFGYVTELKPNSNEVNVKFNNFPWFYRLATFHMKGNENYLAFDDKSNKKQNFHWFFSDAAYKENAMPLAYFGIL